MNSSEAVAKVFVLTASRLYVSSFDIILLMCETCATQMAMRILMVNHCFQLPMAELCNIKILLSFFKGQEG